MIGIVYRDDLNVNLELVRQGHGWAYRQYLRKDDSGLCIAEAAARTAKKGLWALPAKDWIAPWEWWRKKSLAAFTDYTNETVANCVATIGSVEELSVAFYSFTRGRP